MGRLPLPDRHHFRFGAILIVLIGYPVMLSPMISLYLDLACAKRYCDDYRGVRVSRAPKHE